MQYIYPDRESRFLEFKSILPHFHHLIKTCVAFANGVGGKIIIGVDDKTRKIIGIDDKIRDRIYDEFPNSLYDATSPGLLAEIYEKRFDDSSVIIIDIPSSIKKPVFIKNEGIPQGVYLRAGSNTRKATPEYIDELMRENKRMSFDEEAMHENTNILSDALLKHIFKKIDIERLLAEKIIVRASANSENYYPTVTGVLSFCDNPHLYIPEAVVYCTRFRGTAGRDIIQSEEIEGPFIKQVETSFEIIKSWLMRDYTLLGAKLKGKMIVPEIALREAIINALLHRKYWIPGATKIALYDNRLEIFNPGNFPGILNPAHLGDGTTYLRNPHLARVARRFGLAEKLGTGIKLIFESCQLAGLKKPEYIESADSIKVVFSFLPSDDKFSLDEEKLLQLFSMQQEVKLSDVEQHLSVSRNTATRKLNKLIKTGEIIRMGKGPSVRYIKNVRIHVKSIK